MYTSFNDNQNLPINSDEPEAAKSLKCLKLRSGASFAKIRCLSATLPQILWQSEVNRSNINFNLRWYEYSCLVAEKSLIWEFLPGIPPLERDFLVAICDCSSKKPQSFATESFILAKNGVYWAKNFSLRKRRTNHGPL